MLRASRWLSWNCVCVIRRWINAPELGFGFILLAFSLWICKKWSDRRQISSNIWAPSHNHFSRYCTFPRSTFNVVCLFLKPSVCHSYPPFERARLSWSEWAEPEESAFFHVFFLPQIISLVPKVSPLFLRVPVTCRLPRLRAFLNPVFKKPASLLGSFDFLCSVSPMSFWLGTYWAPIVSQGL